MPDSLAGEYEFERFDAKLAAVVLESVAKAHPANADPDIIIDRASRVLASLQHLSGAVQFTNGMDTFLEVGMYGIRFADNARENPFVPREINPASE